MDFDELVPVPSGLFVEDTQRVHELVDCSSFGAQAVGSCGIWGLQAHDLSAAKFADEGPAAFGVLYGPDEEVVFGFAVPWDEADARHEVESVDGFHDGYLVCGLCGRILDRGVECRSRYF